MATDAGSETATEAITATGQQATSWSNPAKARSAPGGDPSGWHGSWPAPEVPEVDVVRGDYRPLVDGGEPHDGASWEGVSGDRQPWGP